MPSSGDIRRQFIDFFTERHGHVFVRSSPVVPHDDPTLLFANAGMNQFKPYFLGAETPEHPCVVNSQKCIRAGGKHNDLEDVGKDTYHHTFFEMLGNWSFGDYFKTEAIDWAWELLTEVWGLEPERLHATYFQGDPDEGLDADEQARDLWRRYLPENHVHPGSKADNFWEMGDTGPCGPCSEIHYDGTADRSGGAKVNRDDAQVIEIWNLVFIQFNRDQAGRLSTLPARHVDTGMGFERIVRILQGKSSNYDTDVFTPLFEAIAEVTGAAPYEGRLDHARDTAYRVIADHIRTLTFALTDGAHCGNEGREYVLRRILRRAVRYGRQTLGIREPFFHRLVPTVVEHMGEAFPELRTRHEAVAEEIRDEEQAFSRTLDRGIALFEDAAERAEKQVISADDAFTLHDTYGFPLDLTQLMADERGMTVDTAGFERRMAEARRRSRAGSGGADLKGVLQDLTQKHALPETVFEGYDRTEWSGPTELWLFDLAACDGGGQTDLWALTCAQTPFYAEAGGQVGDRGQIAGDGWTLHVQDTQRVGPAAFHIGRLEGRPPGEANPQTDVQLKMKVDADRRRLIMANHTATHLLNQALRDRVNPEADQRGSLVDDEKLRFDFSHDAAVSLEQIEAVERQVNAAIASDLSVYAGVADQEQALRIHGLRAVFGEKYPPRVRVVSIGVPVEDLLQSPADPRWAEYSIEFCGGTHLSRTSEAEAFVIVGEESVSRGIRRVTALTGESASRTREQARELRARIASLESAPVDNLEAESDELVKEVGASTLPALERRKILDGIQALQKKVKEFGRARGEKATESVIEQARRIADECDGEALIVRSIAEADGKMLLAAKDVLSKRHPDKPLLLGSSREGKAAFIAAVPKPMIERGLKAGDWVREVAQVAGGGGGGRPDMAQAGGKDPQKVDEALEHGRAFAAQRLE